MTEPTSCCRLAGSDAAAYCDRCDLLVGLVGYHVVAVERDGPGLVVTVESPPGLMGCTVCGVVAVSRGRRVVELVDVPCFGRPVRLRWRKRTWSCPDPEAPAYWVGGWVGGCERVSCTHVSCREDPEIARQANSCQLLPLGPHGLAWAVASVTVEA